MSVGRRWNPPLAQKSHAEKLVRAAVMMFPRWKARIGNCQMLDFGSVRPGCVVPDRYADMADSTTGTVSAAANVKLRFDLTTFRSLLVGEAAPIPSVASASVESGFSTALCLIPSVVAI
ncbi:hypothetical protein FCM35_KLT10835 [Carex littledalei]|uniref:Uncharacterized protein n=1 Tax=Carex littledalei TaxID=544730 RepID=A0A833QJS6_9POAL|nr:hypothetical protein FCM35_KLT10835 [Carex littledalei]